MKAAEGAAEVPSGNFQTIEEDDLDRAMSSGLVSCEQLWRETEGKDLRTTLRVVDATWFLPNSPYAAPKGSRSAYDWYSEGPRIPGAEFFDVDAIASAHPAGLPHMLPSEETFSTAMARLGIRRSTRVVAYDRHGIFSAPRLWYTLKVAFDHPASVAVLDGGLPRWKELGLPLLSVPPEPMGPYPSDSETSWKLRPSSVWAVEQVMGNIDTQKALVVDARSSGRFLGTAPEPRPGMRGGHIPGSVNVPFSDLLDGGQLRPLDQLRERLGAAGVPVEELKAAEGKTIVTSCGSGMTACVVGLAMHRLGLPLERLAVYDGSWSEWGARADTPIVRQGPDGKDEPVA